jgi:hypothetical protein
MGPYARVEYNLTLCPLQSRLQHIYHGQPYARVDLNPMQESTLFPSQRLWIWPLDPGTNTQRKNHANCCCWNRFLLYPPRSKHRHNGYLPFLSPDWQIEAVLISAWYGEGRVYCIVISSDNKKQTCGLLYSVLFLYDLSFPTWLSQYFNFQLPKKLRFLNSY